MHSPLADKLQFWPSRRDCGTALWFIVWLLVCFGDGCRCLMSWQRYGNPWCSVVKAHSGIPDLLQGSDVWSNPAPSAKARGQLHSGLREMGVVLSRDPPQPFPTEGTFQMEFHDDQRI